MLHTVPSTTPVTRDTKSKGSDLGNRVCRTRTVGDEYMCNLKDSLRN